MSLHRVFIKNWVIEAGIGVYPEEQGKKQPIRVNIALFQESIAATKLEDVIDYADHKKHMEVIITAKHHALLETLANELAEAALKDFKVQRVNVEIEKIGIFRDVESCGVSLERSWK